ncbi:MAG: hypothetical protein ACO3IB_05075 [Phycisphaerales bacterium]
MPNRVTTILAALVLALLCVEPQAVAQGGASVKVLVQRPVAVRGAPLLLPVRVEGPCGLALRASVKVGARGGETREFDAPVLWPVRPADTADIANRWATAAHDLRVVRERPDGARDAYLFLDVPADARDGAPIAIAGQSLEPAWIEPAPQDLLARLSTRLSALGPTGEPDPLVSLPDQGAPFERFRFDLGCGLRGWPEPEPYEVGSPADMVARATIPLWRAALARLASASEGVAAEFAELLVARCSDAEIRAPIAAWLADTKELSTVLALILEPARDRQSTADRIASWMRVRSPLLVWIDDEDRGSIMVAIANPSTEEQVVRFDWIAEGEAPLAAVVQPMEIARMRIARPTPPEVDGAAIPRNEALALRMEHRGQARSITVLPESLPAGMAGCTLARFVRPLALVAVAPGVERATDGTAPTFAAVRPRLTGWEIFLEARVPTGVDPSQAGRMVIAGPRGTSIAIAADGSVEDPDGLLGGAPIEFAVYPDRIRAGFAVPPSWIDRSDGAMVLSLGFSRETPVGRQDAPFAGTPWRALPKRVRIDLLARE